MSNIKKSLSTERLLTTTITISKHDQEYLNRTVAALKRSHPKTNRSELIALGWRCCAKSPLKRSNDSSAVVETSL
jgi:hypothetical protein